MSRSVLIAFCIYTAVSLCAAAWVYQEAFRSALSSDKVAGEVRLSGAVSRFKEQLQVYKALANIVAKDPVTEQILTDYDQADDETNFSQLGLTYGAWKIELVAPYGTVVASLPENIKRQPIPNSVIKSALDGSLGYDISVNGAKRLVMFSRRVAGRSGDVLGAVVVSANLAELEFEWPVIPEPVIFLDGNNRAVSSNRPFLFLRTHNLDGRTGDFPLEKANLFGGHDLWDYTNEEGIKSEVQLLDTFSAQLNMTALILLETSSARRSALLAMGLALALAIAIGLVAWIFVQQQRRIKLELKHNATLEQRVDERTLELREAQSELVEASNLAALGRLSAGVSHELNQPLSAILNFAENSKRFLQKSRPEKVDENLNEISQQVNRITRIIGNLRAFARQEQTAFDLVDVAKIARRSLKLVSNDIKAANISVELDISETPCMVMAGKVRLEQVLLNLLSNAIDAMQDADKRVLTLSVQPRNDNIEVVISDTGEGMSEPDRVFEPFYTTKELGASKGLGMGLALSHGLISNFGGTLTGSNQKQGARFVITLRQAKGQADG